jgi:hypothetical protein
MSAGEVRWKEFLYEFKAGLRAAACGGRPRAGSDTTGAGGTRLTLDTGKSTPGVVTSPITRLRVMPRPSREASIAAWLSRCWPCSGSI